MERMKMKKPKAKTMPSGYFLKYRGAVIAIVGRDFSEARIKQFKEAIRKIMPKYRVFIIKDMEDA